MKKIIKIVIIAIFICFFVIPLQGQSERVYERGSVWGVNYIKTKPGHFDDYLENLSKVWKIFQDEAKKDGIVLSYKVLSVANTRDDEPDLILLVEYKNWATLDTPTEYWDEVGNKIMGSLDNLEKDNIDREQLRTLRGSLTANELIFK